MKREVERKIKLVEEGGYIVSVDHAVSADVPFQNYSTYIRLIKEKLRIG